MDLSKLTLEELSNLNREVVDMMRLKQSQLTNNFRVGQFVKFKDKYNRDIFGEITKINQKTISVVTGDYFTWKCSPNLISLITKEEYLKNKAPAPVAREIKITEVNSCDLVNNVPPLNFNAGGK